MDISYKISLQNYAHCTRLDLLSPQGKQKKAKPLCRLARKVLRTAFFVEKSGVLGYDRDNSSLEV